MGNEEKYNGGTEEEFLAARKQLLDERAERAKDPRTLIPFEKLEYFLEELDKMEEAD